MNNARSDPRSLCMVTPANWFGFEMFVGCSSDVTAGFVNSTKENGRLTSVGLGPGLTNRI